MPPRQVKSPVFKPVTVLHVTTTGVSSRPDGYTFGERSNQRRLQLPGRTHVNHEVACATLQGRTHRINQDTGGAWSWQRGDGTPLSLIVVADGVSAGRHSEEASRLVVAELHRSVANSALDENVDLKGLMTLVTDVILSAGETISARPRSSMFSADATTLVVAVALGESVAGGWIGDSRVYLLSAGAASRLTRDHSWAEEAVQHGILSAEQAAADPRSHMITRWIGPQDGNTPDLDTFHCDLSPTDVLLCCSDGLYGYFVPPSGEEHDMATEMAKTGVSLQLRLDALVRQAMDRGGHDDITAAALQVAPPGTNS